MQTFLVEHFERNDRVFSGQPIGDYVVLPAFTGDGNTTPIDANSRVEAFLKFYKQKTDKTDTKDITVETVEGGNPLGFTDEEIQQIQKAGINLEVGEKINHIHIKSIKEF